MFGYGDGNHCFQGNQATAAFQAHGERMKKAIAELSAKKTHQTYSLSALYSNSGSTPSLSRTIRLSSFR